MIRRANDIERSIPGSSTGKAETGQGKVILVAGTGKLARGIKKTARGRGKSAVEHKKPSGGRINQANALADRSLLLAANNEYRITNKKYQSTCNNSVLEVLPSWGEMSEGQRGLKNNEYRLPVTDLRSTETNKLETRSLQLAANNNIIRDIKTVALMPFNSSPSGGSPEGDGGRTVANNKNHHAYAT